TGRVTSCWLSRKPPSHENVSGTMMTSSTLAAITYSSARWRSGGRRVRERGVRTVPAVVPMSANETGPLEITPEREPLVEQRHHERQEEDHARDGAGVTEQSAPELVVELRRHRRRGADRAALGGDPDEVEQLEGADDREEDRDPQG